VSTIATCSSCGAASLSTVLSLGDTPLANRLLTGAELSDPEPRFPLDLVVCTSCSLVQITERVSPEVLFREYAYFSSFSETMQRHAAALADKLVHERRLDSASLVAEIASNDGYFLTHVAARGVPVLGIEPARNIANVAIERGVPTVIEFFGSALAAQLVASGRSADVIVANNVMAHVPDINGVVAGVRSLLKPRGVFVTESPYVKDLVDHLEIDTIYHEHLYYYSLTAQHRLFQRHGMEIVDVERIAIHGGSLRVTAAPTGAEPVNPSVATLLNAEHEWGLDTVSYYEGFAARVRDWRSRLRELLSARKAEGRRIAAYGASAKGTTLLAYAGIGAETLDFVVDRSTYKQGRFTPGTHLPIHAPAHLLEARPHDVLLLTWNFADEILEQQAEYRRGGGSFIIPIPEPKVM
jgi:SAM-dependent methyltransferase